MHTVVALVLAFVASSLAFQITSPGGTTTDGWTNSGPQTITYDRVDTDPGSFTVTLIDQTLNSSSQLEAQVTTAAVGSNITITVYPPSGGWVPDPNYRVRFMSIPDSSNNSTGILAQSGLFAIQGSPSSSGTSSGTSVSATAVVPTATTESTGTSDSSASDSASVLPTSSSSSAAALSYRVQTGILGLFSLLGFVLA